MRVLLIGGTRFTGPALVRELLERHHEVSFLHRGETHDPRTDRAREIIADRKDRSQLADAVATTAPDVVIDMIPFTAEDAVTTKAACKGVVSRIVALSSIDVYLAFGRIHRTETGPLQATPLTEESALRETNQPGGPECDKIAVERAYLNDAEFPATILRLPAIYGARDKYRRLHGYLKRMDDGRRTILLGETLAAWKFSRGYVDNVAHAIALAAENERAAGEIYNVAEPRAMTELEFVRTIGATAEWNGDIRVMPDDELPAYLQPSVNFRQNWDVDTQKIREHLGYSEIVDVQEAFRRTVEWDRAHPPDVDPFEYRYEEEDEVLARELDIKQ